MMQYIVRTFIEGQEKRLDGICRTFPSKESSAYNMLRANMDAGSIKAILRERYRVKNARWIQSAIKQAKAVMTSRQG